MNRQDHFLYRVPKRLVIVVTCATLILGIIASVNHLFSVDGLLTEAQVAFDEKNYQKALAAADSVISVRPDSRHAILIAAESAEKLGDLKAAITRLEELPKQFDHPEIHRGWLLLSELQMKIGQLSLARSSYEMILDHIPQDVVARSRLSRLLSGCGYEFEAVRVIRPALQYGELSLDDLFRLATNGKDLFGDQELSRFRQLNPNESMAAHGAIQLAANLRDAAMIDHILAQQTWQDLSISLASLKHKAHQISNQAANGGAADDTMQELFSKADNHPATWLIAAERLQHQGLFAEATTCFHQVLNIDPWNESAVFAVANLTRTQHPGISTKFNQLGQRLQKLRANANAARRNPNAAEAIRAIISNLLELGRRDEAIGWSRQIRDASLRTAIAREMHTTAGDENGLPFRHPNRNLKKHTSHLTLTDVLHLLRPSVTAEGFGSAFGFELIDVANTAGLDFVYHNGAAPNQEGLFMHQWTGGGVGILDIDHDDWPDMFFSQGGQLQADSNSETWHDTLYRNHRGERFSNETSISLNLQSGFGQGVAIGDINNDGFEDIYIARAGQNCLLLNHGDGTFGIPQKIPVSQEWTTSAAIADLNSDGIPDIYDVNYLAGEAPFHQTCNHEGYQRTCGPTDFPAAQDRVLLANGDGSLTDVSTTAFGRLAASRGMGLVISSIMADSGNQAYIANDESPNQLFAGFDSQNQLTESAVSSGTAINRFGNSQGSMGIAFGDANNNAHPDLFVTNYYSEENNLFIQDESGIFVEAINQSDLAPAGFAMLGFGCQFVDLNVDGHQDLVVANGHLDNFTHLGQPWKMRPQYFHGSGQGRFDEVTPDGEYFHEKVLGRAMARLDWNGDGRPDVVITHLDRSPALLHNNTNSVLKVLTISVVGTACSRDAVGARLTLQQHGAHHQTQWITAGDGYECSNQRMCLFGRTANNNSVSVQIDWPAAPSHTVLLTTGPRRFRFVQGRTMAYEIPM